MRSPPDSPTAAIGGYRLLGRWERTRLGYRNPGEAVRQASKAWSALIVDVRIVTPREVGTIAGQSGCLRHYA